MCIGSHRGLTQRRRNNEISGGFCLSGPVFMFHVSFIHFFLLRLCNLYILIMCASLYNIRYNLINTTHTLDSLLIIYLLIFKIRILSPTVFPQSNIPSIKGIFSKKHYFGQIYNKKSKVYKVSTNNTTVLKITKINIYYNEIRKSY